MHIICIKNAKNPKLRSLNNLILQPIYFAPVIQYVALASAEELTYEIEDNFQKQTYRNRCYIYGANGVQLLTVPILHTRTDRNRRTRDVKIDHSFSWEKLHIKSLQSAYRSSPFFEYYEDDILSLYHKKHRYLLDLNFETIALIADCLQLENNYKKTNQYQFQQNSPDYRSLANAKSKQIYNLAKYKQVFDDKHGFISNLSILDLLFNEGTNALTYLESQNCSEL